MLKHRLITGPLMLALLALVLYLDNRLDRVTLHGFWRELFLGRQYLPAGLLMLALFIVMIVLAGRELCGIFRAKGIDASPTMVVLSAVLGCTLIYIVPIEMNSQNTLALFATILTVLFIAVTIQYSWMHQRTQGAVAVCGVTLLALIYLGTLPGFYVAIRRWHSAWIVAAMIVTAKSCDIGAYFTGRAIGRHKLIPWLSPGKTWEGLAGGVLLSALVGMLFAWIINSAGYQVPLGTQEERVWQEFRFPLLGAALGGALLGLVGQFGDLTASLFKRDAGIKDSGNTIPGFGGLLDVIDSPIVVAPVAYWLLRLAAWWHQGVYDPMLSTG